MELASKKYSMKIREPPHPWEYYIAKQIQNRVKSEDIVRHKFEYGKITLLEVVLRHAVHALYCCGQELCS